MVGVIVAGEYSTQVHVIAVKNFKNVSDTVGGVNNDRVAGLPVADEVHKICHLSGHRIVGGEVSA